MNIFDSVAETLLYLLSHTVLKEETKSASAILKVLIDSINIFQSQLNTTGNILEFYVDVFLVKNVGVWFASVF